MIYTNPQSELALKIIRDTGTNLFLTGKAGTGKTTFLKQLKEFSPKRMIVVAPTGVAAINAGGVTIHSFFQLSFGPYLPNAQVQQQHSYKFSREKKNIIRSIDLLVIDEVSMVRADLLDAISDVLRRFRNPDKPFGGVQLLLIGDLQQLAPVAKEEEWEVLKPYYDSPFFFDSKALKNSAYLSVELLHVYRQEDNEFIHLLNNIRENRFDDETLNRLNQRYRPDLSSVQQEGYITLTTHNHLAQQINNQKLSELPGDSYRFKAEVKDDFPAYSYPTEDPLELKTGAQVMFVKNDLSGERKYYNGKIGKIVFLNPTKIIVVDEFGHEIIVNKETWQNTKYTIDAETQNITETITGSFTQYPLKTAWAITIHKSQGLTFERAIIDAAAAFSHGQVYVALSRCRSLEGLILSNPINRNAMISDGKIRQYTDYLSGIMATEGVLQIAEQQYYLHLATELFDFTVIQQRLQYAAHVIYAHLQRLYPKMVEQYAVARGSFHQEITEVGNRFQQQLNQMIAGNPNYREDETIQERIRKGTVYFYEKIKQICYPLRENAHVEIDNKETLKLVSKAINNLIEELTIKTVVLTACRQGFSPSVYLAAKAKAHIEPEKKKKTPRSKKSKEAAVIAVDTSDIKNPILYEVLRQWRNKQAAQKGLPVYTILQQKALIGLSNAIPSSTKEMLLVPGVGKKVLDKYGEELMAIIDSYKGKL